MKFNLRWLVQAGAFIGCIYFFIRILEYSKLMLAMTASGSLPMVGLFCLLFGFCFFLMALTSYLKQKQNGTLKNQIPFFEKLISKLGLAR